MDYKLAKKLKDAGFPQHTEGQCTNRDCYGFNYCMPSLSELIEACGEAFHMLLLDNEEEKEWRAHSRGKPWKMTRASTPEEAVARLWLALNKKP